MTKPVFSDLLQQLEAERNDLSYKTPPKVRVDTVFVKEKVYITSEKRKQRDKLMFHAGRAAAGATDKVALEAAKWLEELSE
jgi:hypothetical protein